MSATNPLPYNSELLYLQDERNNDYLTVEDIAEVYAESYSDDAHEPQEDFLPDDRQHSFLIFTKTGTAVRHVFRHTLDVLLFTMVAGMAQSINLSVATRLLSNSPLTCSPLATQSKPSCLTESKMKLETTPTLSNSSARLSMLTSKI